MKKQRTKYRRLNAYVCSECKDLMVSLSVHDFARCRCGKNFTDGGFDYIRATVGAVALNWYVKETK